VAVTGRQEVRARAVGLVLVAAGGLLAATAKASFVPLLAVALVVAAVTAVGRRRWVGLGVAGALALVAIAPVAAGVQWQQRHFAGVNTHNLVYTAVLPDVGGAALGPLGLPPAALSAAGRAYYPNGVDGLPGAEVVAADPAAARSAAYGVLLAHPAAAAGALGRGLTATLGAGLSYLPSAPVTPASVPAVLGTTVGPQGADRAQLLAWLDGLALPWLPAAVVVAGLLAGVLTLRRGRDGGMPRACQRGDTADVECQRGDTADVECQRGDTADVECPQGDIPDASGAASGDGRGVACRVIGRGAGRLAALAAVSAVGLVAAAVLGDGYFEIAKHVWLAAYLLVVTAVAVVLGIAVWVVRRAAYRRPAPTPSSGSRADAAAGSFGGVPGG